VAELAARLGFKAGQLVQEFGWDTDADEALRDAIVDQIAGGDPPGELADEDYDGVADAVLIWWRDGDGDLTDMLVDALTALDDGGAVWLLTPKAGRKGAVQQFDVEEAATTAGLHAMNAVPVADSWTATRLGNRGRGR
jgi:hypothetical protein